jgi:hypothetical protein
VIPWGQIWLLDTSKQCFGAGMAHLSNLVISIEFAHIFGGVGHADEVSTAGGRGGKGG